MSKIAMARSYAHKSMTDMKRQDMDEYDEISFSESVDHPELGRCLIGNFVCGIGAFNVHFPVDAVRLVTDQERDAMLRGTYVGCGQKFRLKPKDFASQADIDAALSHTGERT